MAQLKAQLANFDNSANTMFVTTNIASHTFPIGFDSTGDNACSISWFPCIGNCEYDGVGAMLKWIYGNLKARNTGTVRCMTVSYAQTGSFGAAGLDTTGYLYVPKACVASSSTVCELHVAMHGCLQSYSQIGNMFLTNTGYALWPGSNKIMILFPQAIIEIISRYKGSYTD